MEEIPKPKPLAVQLYYNAIGQCLGNDMKIWYIEDNAKLGGGVFIVGWLWYFQK